MKKPITHLVVKCVLSQPCKKCGSIKDAIVVEKGPHLSLYCAKCGAYLKHASRNDEQFMYSTEVELEVGTPLKVIHLHYESESSIFK